MSDAYLAALTAARKQLEMLRQRRQEIDLEIARLAQVIASLKPIAEPDKDDTGPRGLTDRVRAVLRGSDRALSPTEIRDQLVKIGQDLSAYKQFMASLHVVLKRLVKSGEVVDFEISDGTTRYWWSLNGNKPIVIPPGTITISAPAALTAVTSQPLGTPEVLKGSKPKKTPRRVADRLAAEMVRRPKH